MQNGSLEINVNTQGNGSDTQVVNTSELSIGSLSVGDECRFGLFSSTKRSHFGIQGVCQFENGQSSGLNAQGYQNSTYHSASLFGANVIGSQETQIGSEGLSYREEHSFFGKKVGFGFHLPAIPNLGIVDAFNRMPLPHLDIQGISHLKELKLSEITEAIQDMVRAGRDSGIIEIGGQMMKVAHSGAKIVVEVVEVVAEVAKAMK
jgi:hypothetical protein